jgi:hypothetical protein
LCFPVSFLVTETYNFLLFSIFQAYFASCLNTPHYQIGASDLPDFLESIRSFKSTNCGNKSLEVVHLANGENHLDPYLNVFNSLSHTMHKITSSLPLQELAKLVLADNKAQTPVEGTSSSTLAFQPSTTRSTSGVASTVALPPPNLLKKTPSTQPDSIFHQAFCWA